MSLLLFGRHAGCIMAELVLMLIATLSIRPSKVGGPRLKAHNHTPNIWTFDFGPLTLNDVNIDSIKVNAVIKLLNNNVHTPHQGERWVQIDLPLN